MIQKLTSAYVKNKKVTSVTSGEQFISLDEFISEEMYEEKVEKAGSFISPESVIITFENGVSFNVYSLNNEKLGLTVDLANDSGDLLPLTDIVGKTLKTFRVIEDDRMYIKFNDDTVLEVSIGHSHEETGAIEWSITYNSSVYIETETFQKQPQIV